MIRVSITVIVKFIPIHILNQLTWLSDLTKNVVLKVIFIKWFRIDLTNDIVM